MFDLEVFTTVAIVALMFVPPEALLPARRRPERHGVADPQSENFVSHIVLPFLWGKQ